MIFNFGVNVKTWGNLLSNTISIVGFINDIYFYIAFYKSCWSEIFFELNVENEDGVFFNYIYLSFIYDLIIFLANKIIGYFIDLCSFSIYK